nr:histidine kinase [Actinomadura spongiicola]
MSDAGARLDRIYSVGGCMARVAYAGFAGLYLLACLIIDIESVLNVWTVFVAAVANVAAISGRRFLGWGVLAASLSAVTTLIGLAMSDDLRWPVESVMAEIGALLILLVRTAWRTSRRRLVLMAALLGAAILATPLRSGPLAAMLLTAPLGIAVAIAVGIGLYLRAVDARRARSLVAARRDERLELARDLHDFVAHHVTGIVVQAQAARFAAQPGSARQPTPEQIDAMFDGIERAGTEALTSMRRMVGLLRDAQHVSGDGATGEDAATRPVGDLSQLRDLVTGFAHPPAALTLAPDLGTLPPEVATSAHRVVQEALTNVRKHAADADTVLVSLTRVGGEVEVTVRDDGRGRGRRLPSGGFGLTGLSERVGALGGRLRAGPRPEGGWEVVAVLPAGDR